MLVVILRYKVPLSVIDQHLEAHKTFLKQGYEQGLLVMSGPRPSRSGGIIIANSDQDGAVWEFLRNDPFYEHDLADYQVLPFTPTMNADALCAL